MTVEPVVPGKPTPDQRRIAAQAEALAHLLACLDHAADELHAIGADVDARVIQAHRAQLARGHEWPGDPITPPDLERPATGRAFID